MKTITKIYTTLLVIFGLVTALVTPNLLSSLQPTSSFNNFEVVQAASSGITYYVDASIGNDSNNGTTETAALKTIDKAAEKVVPGDTVLVKNGTYNEPYGINMRKS